MRSELEGEVGLDMALSSLKGNMLYPPFQWGYR
jgi:hypothetical protein